MDRIQRNGEWWQRQPTGEWLRFDAASGQWVSGGSPPPPPPPPAAAFDDGPYVALTTARSRFSMPQVDRRVGIAGGLAVLVVLLVVAGFMMFGGNEPGVDLAAAASAPLPEPEPKSKKVQFIHDADQICADVLTAARKLPNPTSIEGVVAVLQEVRKISDAATKRAFELKVPRDARKGWDRYVGHPEDGRRIDQAILAAQRGDLATLQALTEDMARDGRRDHKWAARYGMKVCSQELG